MAWVKKYEFDKVILTWQNYSELQNNICRSVVAMDHANAFLNSLIGWKMSD